MNQNNNHDHHVQQQQRRRRRRQHLSSLLSSLLLHLLLSICCSRFHLYCCCSSSSFSFVVNAYNHRHCSSTDFFGYKKKGGSWFSSLVLRKQFQYDDCYIPSHDNDISIHDASFLLSHNSATGYISTQQRRRGSRILPSIRSYQASISSSYSQTQVGTLYEQLDDGARAFDLRPYMLVDGSIVFQHGAIHIYHITYEDAIRDVVLWCNDNPTELVLLMTSHFQYQKGTTTTTSMTEALGTIYDKYGIKYVQCSDIYGMTMGDVMSMSSIRSGNDDSHNNNGYALALDGHDTSGTFCGKTNWIENDLVTCRPNNGRLSNDCTKRRPFSTTNKRIHALQSYVLDSVNNPTTNNDNELGPPSDLYNYPFNEIQGIWQVDVTSATNGIKHLSSIINDNTLSNINAHMAVLIHRDGSSSSSHDNNDDTDYFRSPISLFAVDNVAFNGNALLSVLRTRCDQISSSSSRNKDQNKNKDDDTTTTNNNGGMKCGSQLPLPIAIQHGIHQRHYVKRWIPWIAVYMCIITFAFFYVLRKRHKRMITNAMKQHLIEPIKTTICTCHNHHDGDDNEYYYNNNKNTTTTIDNNNHNHKDENNNSTSIVFCGVCHVCGGGIAANYDEYDEYYYYEDDDDDTTNNNNHNNHHNDHIQNNNNNNSNHQMVAMKLAPVVLGFNEQQHDHPGLPQPNKVNKTNNNNNNNNNNKANSRRAYNNKSADGDVDATTVMTTASTTNNIIMDYNKYQPFEMEQDVMQDDTKNNRKHTHHRRWKKKKKQTTIDTNNNTLLSTTPHQLQKSSSSTSTSSSSTTSWAWSISTSTSQKEQQQQERKEPLLLPTTNDDDTDTDDLNNNNNNSSEEMDDNGNNNNQQDDDLNNKCHHDGGGDSGGGYYLPPQQSQQQQEQPIPTTTTIPSRRRRRRKLRPRTMAFLARACRTDLDDDDDGNDIDLRSARTDISGSSSSMARHQQQQRGWPQQQQPTQSNNDNNDNMNDVIQETTTTTTNNNNDNNNIETSSTTTW